MVLALSVCLAACGRGRGRGHDAPAGSAPVAAGDAGVSAAELLAPLHAFEDARRHAADFAHLPPSDRALGPDPIAIRALPGGRFVGLLRGRDAVVLLDESLHEIARAPAPALPTGLAVSGGEIAISGEQSPSLFRYHVEGNALRGGPGDPLREGLHGLRDVALSDGGLVEYAVDEREGKLYARSTRRPGIVTTAVSTGAGAFRVARVGEQLVVDCLLDHALEIFAIDARGMPAAAPPARVHHDGPIWSFDAVPLPDGILVAAGGVEDHPLDRTEGSFGFVDSFVFLYRVPAHGEPERVAVVNVSELGVITPKAISLRLLPGGGAAVTVAGYGSDKLADLTWSASFGAPVSTSTRTILPGVASLAVSGDRLVFADPLLDAWFAFAPSVISVPVPDGGAPPRDPLSRVGEALFFTNLMAPWNHAEGRLSRFTCETCHFEGYVDGRTHHTGRGDVRATTKPLLGLFNNRPHFSRALDPDLATMVYNEFNVAGAKSDHDAWFAAADTGLPWVDKLGVPVAELSPTTLRRALMTFLMDFGHRPNPAALGRASFTDAEQKGAAVFAARCERCHEARLVADDAATRLPPAQWEKLVLSREGPVVWAAAGYHQTGVEPYVHEGGARSPSLRRLYKKRPYFTNGSAKSLGDVLDRVRFQGDGFWHDHGPANAEALAPADREALLAFLDLL